MHIFAGFLTASGRASQPLRRRLAGYGLAAALMPLLALLLTLLPGQLSPATDAVAFVIAVMAVALLAASLLDMSRLQAGAIPVFPRPADVGEIIGCSLEALGPPAREVTVHVPAGLPQVTADPALMERVIANVTANALRYSPAGRAPLLMASARGCRVELRVIDHGPGVSEADRDRMFAPFQRLAGTSTTTGVGLGLTVSRGLAEAMGGTLRPEETPGGGLTMTLSMPAARGRPQPPSDAPVVAESAPSAAPRRELAPSARLGL
jgi:two-component system sensor histidine kinase KdpD